MDNRNAMLLAAYNLLRFDHVSQLLNFRVLVPTKCRCCCAQVNDAEFNLLAVERDETTVRGIYDYELVVTDDHFNKQEGVD